ncbi:MAG: bacteriohemerythrin [Rhodocyclaceae bacterium]|nr:bacteriohemerythrin [Rhodocyclaceae bacterium]
MPAFEWKDFFSVGHDGIDHQHKQLFAIVNELYDGTRRDGDASEELLRRTIAALGAYIRTHFAEEERLMRLAAYPEYARHKQAHDGLIARVAEFEARIRTGEVRQAAGLLPFLVGEWLTDHIAFEDQQYAGCVNSHACNPHAKYSALQELESTA